MEMTSLLPNREISQESGLTLAFWETLGKVSVRECINVPIIIVSKNY